MLHKLLSVMFILGISHSKYLGLQSVTEFSDLTLGFIGCVEPIAARQGHSYVTLLDSSFPLDGFSLKPPDPSSSSPFSGQPPPPHTYICPTLADVSMYLSELLKRVQVLSFGFDFHLSQKFYVTLITLISSFLKWKRQWILDLE